MKRSKRIFTYDIPTIPDSTHHRLLTLCGGNVRESIFQATEHLLRMLTSFEENQLTLGFRFIFSPNTNSNLQSRLRLQLSVKISDDISEDTVKQLIETGPLAEFYNFIPNTSFKFDSTFSAVSEVIRQEEVVEPLVPKELNPNIPSMYYSLSPFEAREDNDFLMIDRLLSKMQDSCMIEFLISPVDHTVDLETHYRYITRLMSINQYGDDLYDETSQTNPYGEYSFQDTSMMSLAKKKDPIADEILQDQQDMHRILRQPQLLFNIRVFAARPEQSIMLASAIAEAGFAEGKYRILSYDDRDSQNADKVNKTITASGNLNLSLNSMYSKIWDRELPEKWKEMSRLCRLATVNELKGIIRFPVGGYGSPRCIRKDNDPVFKCGNKDKKSERSVFIGYDLESSNPLPHEMNLSDLKSEFQTGMSNNLELRLPLKSFAKHIFISGVPGSGKTTAVLNILVQLFQYDIPFLIIEPAKTEYRILKTLREHPDPSVRNLAEQMQVFTPGNDDISPFRFNPLAYPEGITLDEHISQILSSFEAAMPMGGPLQALIAEAVEEVYEGISGTTFPEMIDLLDATRRIMEKKNYEGEVRSNLQAAIEVRLGLITRRAMGRIFQTKRSIPSIEELLSYPTIIEMDYLSQDHACLLTLFLLTAIREHIKIDPNRKISGLHHVTVIEEAHNIVGKAGNAKASEEIADPKAFAAHYVSRMLAELRALGEGIIIADQLPSTVASEVVKNTGTKIAHRLVSKEDREDLGYAMLLGENEIEEIARFSPGEAYLYTEGLYRPRRTQGLNANEYLQLAGFPDKNILKELISEDDWFIRCKNENYSLLRKTISHTLDKARLEFLKFEDQLLELSNQDDNDIDYEIAKSLCIEFNETLKRFESRFSQLNIGIADDNNLLLKAISAIHDRWKKSLLPNYVQLQEEYLALEDRIINL